MRSGRAPRPSGSCPSAASAGRASRGRSAGCWTASAGSCAGSATSCRASTARCRAAASSPGSRCSASWAVSRGSSRGGPCAAGPPTPPRPPSAPPAARGETPAALERRAEEAERRGDHEAALRLRFRAGLLRLDARGAIAFRPSLPTGEVAQALRSDAFDRLAADFDDVVYGGREADADDVATARREWERVLESAR